MDYELKTGIIIVAGGSGRRCGGGIPKQFKLLGGMPVLARTINRFGKALAGADIVVVLPEEHIPFWQNLASRFEVAAHRVVAGGAERFHSVKNGLAALKGDERIVAIHDGVRPLASEALIRRVAAAAAEHGAAIPVTEVVDSYREVTESGSAIADRSRLRIVQTPQIFRAEILRKAYDQDFDSSFTDDASVVEAAGGTIFLAVGERNNLKITTPEDFIIAEALIAAEEENRYDNAEHI